MFERLILKQIFIFNLEEKIRHCESVIEKTSLTILLEKIRKEGKEEIKD